jgi:8-hydroxy-5-deazaflavin:NADPH oxidoreductase
MTTAIIGTGAIGARVARLLHGGGETVLLVNRDPGKAEALAEGLGDRARATTAREAAAGAEAVIIAVPFATFADVVDEIADLLPGRLVIDPTNPVGVGPDGSLVRLLPEGESAGQQLSALLPDGSRYAKAFGTLSAGLLDEGAHRSPPAVLYYATDDDGVVPVVERLIGEAGFAAVRAGGVAEASGRIEVGGDLHTFGGLDGELLDAVAARARL